MGVPDHVRRAILEGKSAELSEYGRRGGVKSGQTRRQKANAKRRKLNQNLPLIGFDPSEPRDGKSKAGGNDD